jgi:hypothetical protein
MSPHRSRTAVSMTVPIAFLVALVVALSAIAVSPANARGGSSRAGQTRARAAGPGVDRAAGPELNLSMNGKKSRKSPGVTGLKNDGRSNLKVGVATRDGGRAKLVRGRTTRHAVRLPSLSNKLAPPKAEIRVTVAGRGAPLDPGTRDFVFGADFLLDRVSDGGRRDDGDNLIQRGQFNSQAQYKIQLDHSVAYCRVKGSDGAVAVLTSHLTRNRWYRVRCQRTADTVRLRVWKLKKQGPHLVADVSQTGVIGDVTQPRTRALSIGGRLNNKNVVPRGHTDQFNGVVDQVLYDVLP